jgi:hypothetical protein
LVDQLLANNPEAAAYGEYVNPIVAKVDNRWIKITKDDISKLSSASKDEVDTCTEALKSFKISKNDSKQLKKLFKENQFIIVSEKLKNETAANENSFHYKLDFNNAAAEGFAKQVITLESFKSIKQSCELDEKKIVEIKEKVETELITDFFKNFKFSGDDSATEQSIRNNIVALNYALYTIRSQKNTEP